jgi:hypothetical protein
VAGGDSHIAHTTMQPHLTDLHQRHLLHSPSRAVVERPERHDGELGAWRPNEELEYPLPVQSAPPYRHPTARCSVCLH